ncbi:hypothetical protein BVI1335_70073 [Burkholderia vietnamiensis]|nr:hypothetical protein BVI1335_70073 [Burkholderia vietnamiensis]
MPRDLRSPDEESNPRNGRERMRRMIDWLDRPEGRGREHKLHRLGPEQLPIRRHLPRISISVHALTFQ